MGEKLRIIEPSFLRGFKCDGSSCHAECCRGWSVRFDGATVKKYRAIADEKIRKNIFRHLKNFDKNSKGASVDFGDGISCPFLMPDYLCCIQKHLGEAYLSDVCAVYPRVYNRAGDTIECAAMFSCPIISRLELFADDIEFCETGNANIRLAMAKDIKSGCLSDMNNFLLLQRAGIRILKDKSLAVDERLLLLAALFDVADKVIADGGEARIAALASGLTEGGGPRETLAMMRDAPYSHRRYIEWILGVIEALYSPSRDIAFPPIYIFREFESLYHVKAGGSMEEVALAYEKAWSGNGERLIARFGGILGNYLINEFWAMAYPCRLDATLSENFMVFLAVFKVIELCLLTLVAKNENACDDEAVMIIRLIAQQSEHNVNFETLLLPDIREQGAGVNLAAGLLRH